MAKLLDQRRAIGLYPWDEPAVVYPAALEVGRSRVEVKRRPQPGHEP